MPGSLIEKLTVAVIDAVGALVVVLDRAGRIVRFNRAAEECTGWKAGEVEGRTYWDVFILPDEAAHVSQVFDALAAGDYPNAHENHWLTKSGEPRLIAWSNTAVTDDRGGVTHIVATGLDVTDQRRAETELAAQQDHLEALVVERTKALKQANVALELERDRLAEASAALARSEALFRVAAESLSDVIYEWDLQDRVDWYGDIDQLMGYAPGEFPRTLGDWAETVHPADRERVFAAIQTHLAGEAPYDIEYRVLRKDGREATWSARGTAIRDDDGRPTRWIGAITDITERRRAEAEALRQAGAVAEGEARYRTLLDALPQNIFQKDRQSVYQLANRSYASLLGVEPSGVPGTTDYDHYPGDLADRYRADDQRIMDTGEIEELEEEFEQNGRRGWVHTVKVPLRATGGEVTGVLGIFWDVTELRNAQHQLRERIKEMRALVYLSELSERHGDDLEAIVAELVPALPGAWQYPAITCAKLRLNGASAASHGFVDCDDRLAEPIRVDGETVGQIEVGYREPRPAEDIGPFLTEEAVLLHALAERLGHIAGRVHAARRLREAGEKLRLEEPRHRSLTGALTSVVWITDADGAFIEPQPAWERYTGQSWAEHQGFGWADALHPDDREQVKALWLEALGERREYRSSGRVWCASAGGYHWFEARGVPLLDDAGEVREWVGNITDVDNQRRAEHALALRSRIAEVFANVEEEELYNAVLDLVLDRTGSEFGVFGYIDEHGSLVVPTMTRKIWEQCQVDQKDVVFPRETWGDSAWPRAMREKRGNYSNEPSRLTPPGHIPVTRQMAMPLLHQGEAIGLLQVANRVTPYDDDLFEELGTIAQIVAPFLKVRVERDRQERLRAMAELALAGRVEDLRRSNQELEYFAYVASHDLQEPLRKITSFGELLRDGCDEMEGDNRLYLERIVASAQRMEDLIDALLAYSRVATRAEPFEPVELGTLAREALDDLELAVREAGAEVDIGPLPLVTGDRAQLRSVFQNLIGNAIKYAREGVAAKIRITGSVVDGMAEIAVSDNGIGFDEKYLDRVFKPFQRLHGRHQYSGTGMGLAICERIVKRHDGGITAASRLGEGSTFTVRLPVDRAREDNE